MGDRPTFSLSFAAILRSISLARRGAACRNSFAPSTGDSPSRSCLRPTSPSQPRKVREVASRPTVGVERRSRMHWASSLAASLLALTASTSVSALSRTRRVRRWLRRFATCRSISVSSVPSGKARPRKRARSVRKTARDGRFSSEIDQTPPGQAKAKRSMASRARAVLPCPPLP